jgi:thioredoxin domain-containing protein 5
MHLLKALGMLPLYLVLTTFSAVISVSAVHLDELTPANFKESTATGTWFVENYSPYCPHCIRFAPTWEKLVGEAETEFPSIHLAQVNCAVHGGVCPSPNHSIAKMLIQHMD